MTPLLRRLQLARFPAHGAVLRLAWPIAVSNVSYMLMSVIDTVLVGRLGTAPLAAMGLGVTAAFVVVSFGLGVMRSVKVVAAQRTGAGDVAGASRLAWQSLGIALVLALPALLFVPLASPALSAVGAVPEVADLASTYLGWRLLGTPILYAQVGLAAWLQGRGDTRTPMVGTLLSNATNVALDVVLIAGLGPVPAFGIAGAGIAAVAGWTIALLWLLRAAAPALRERARFDPVLFAETVRIGAPIGVSMLIDVASFGLFAVLLARVGEIDLAAHVIAIRIVGFSFLPGYAIGEAASVLVGQAVGARRPGDAVDAWRAATGLAVGLMVACGIVFVVAPGPLIGVFGAEPEVESLARELLVVGAAFQVFDALATVAYCALAGAGDTRFAMIWNGLVNWLIKLPIAWVLAVPLELGATGAWLGLTAEIVAVAAINVWRVRSGGWLRQAAAREPTPAVAAA